jgi:hypothetical protein
MGGETNGGGDSARKGYSDAFGRLYKGQDPETGEDDFVGALAYAYYKAQKREFVAGNGLDAADVRVREYHSDLGDIKASQLRELADKRLTELLSAVAQRVEQDLREEVTQGHISDAFRANDVRLAGIEDLIKQTDKNVTSGTALWKSIAAGVAASFVFGLVLTWARVIDWANPFSAKPTATQEQQSTSPKN